MAQYLLADAPRASSSEPISIPLVGRYTEQGLFYFVNATFGTPPQAIEAIIDTGSTDTWVLGERFCNDRKKDSTTAKKIAYLPFFNATYGRDKVNGVYVEDTVGVGPAAIQGVQFGEIDDSTFTSGSALLGLGFDTAEFCPGDTFCYLYPSILDTARNRSVMANRAFGVYICNRGVGKAEGSGLLTLGGFDASKMLGPPVTFPIVSPKSVARLGVSLTAMSAHFQDSSAPLWRWSIANDSAFRVSELPAVLDSGASVSQIPRTAHKDLVRQLNKLVPDGLFEKPGTTEWVGDMDCSHASLDVTVSFTFGTDRNSIDIPVPFSDLVLPWDGGCRFALRSRPQYNSRGLVPTWVNLGSSVVGSLYMGVNYDNATIQVARAHHD